MPITWDDDKRAWVFDDVTEVEPGHFNNLLQYGQPYTPYDAEFRHDLYDGDYMITSPTVIYNNQDVITNGFGQNIQLTDFDVVKNLQQDGADVPNGTYTLTQLQDLGLSKPGQFGDHAMGTNLYINQRGIGVSPHLGAATAAYVFGSIRFQMSEDTTFVIENGQLVSVDGRIELQPDNFDHESTTLPDWVSAIVAVGAGDTANFNEVVILYEGEGANRTVSRIIPESEFCFLSGTPIDMWPLDPSHKPKNDGLYERDALLAKVWQKPIEEITPDDIVLSYDRLGNLIPGKVSRTFQNNVQHLLDVHGLKVTPGHVTLCGDGKYAGRHVPIIDILLSDGALVRENGDLIRMSINKPVGSVEDQMVQVLWAETAEDIQAGNLQTGKMRVGTLLFDRDGEPVSVLDCLQAEGLAFDPETGLVNHPGQAPAALHWFGRLPCPEDYILRRSRETLDGILTDGEWEAMPSALIAEKLRMTRQMQTH